MGLIEQHLVSEHRRWLLKVKQRFKDFDCVNAIDNRRKRFVEFARPRNSRLLIVGVWLIEEQRILKAEVFDEPKDARTLGSMGAAFLEFIAQGDIQEIPK